MGCSSGSSRAAPFAGCNGIVIHDRRRDIGLGGFPLVALARARQQAFAHRKLARAGGDPIALKRQGDVPTFEEAAENVIALHAGNWRDGGKTCAQSRASLRDYAMPRLGRLRVSAITTADVMAVQLPIWHEKRETAHRVRERIGAVIAPPPPRNGALAQVRASAAGTSTKLAFEFLVLTAARSRKVRARHLGRDRPRRGRVDRAGRTHEGEPRTPLAALRVCRRHPQRGAIPRQRRPSGFPEPLAGRRSRSCSRSRASRPCRTASGRAFGTGPQSGPIARARSFTRHSRTSCIAGSRRPPRGPTSSSATDGRCTTGRPTSLNTPTQKPGVGTAPPGGRPICRRRRVVKPPAVATPNLLHLPYGGCPRENPSRRNIEDTAQRRQTYAFRRPILFFYRPRNAYRMRNDRHRSALQNGQEGSAVLRIPR